MEFEIHMFLAIGKAAEASGFPSGELHPLLVFLRQGAGEEHDFDRAESAALAQGWTALDFTKAGTLPSDAGTTMDPAHLGCYQRAVEHGEGLWVYPSVVKPAPAKSKA